MEDTTKNNRTQTTGKVVQLYPPREENNAGTFTCPAYILVQQLLIKVEKLQQQLEKVAPNQSARIDNSQLLQEFHISRGCGQDWRNQGLRFTKIGKKLYYNRADIEAFLAQRQVKGF